MESLRLGSRAVALIAAYALALQGLLAGVGPAFPPGLAQQLSILCSGDGAAGPFHAPEHALPCQAVCAALGHGVAGTAPPRTVPAFPVPPIASAPLSADCRALPHFAHRSPQNPRGPPIA
jgi:hypothetical protein